VNRHRCGEKNVIILGPTLSGQPLPNLTGKEIKPVLEPISDKNPAAVALGRLGGLKGGKARAASLSAKKRKEIAPKAAKMRWSK
jgi:hypothetical protein